MPWRALHDHEPQLHHHRLGIGWREERRQSLDKARTLTTVDQRLGKLGQL